MLLLDHQVLCEIQPHDGPYAAPDFAGAEVRTLDAAHVADIQRLLTSLDQASRCARFGWAANDAALGAHVQNAIGNAQIIFGVPVGGHLRGVLEIYRGSASGCAEVALVVAPEWRRRGFGWALLQAAMRWATAVDAGPMRLIFSRHNWPMRQLTTKAAARFDIVLDEICAEIAPQRIRPRLGPRVSHCTD
jgi:GNAT superfamily N-acetyltransferase